MPYSNINTMTKRKITKIKLFPNQKNKKALEIATYLQQELEKNGYKIVDTFYDLAIAIGGDGSFLRMVKECNFNEQIYYLGINAGTLGFAQEIYPKDIESFLQRLKKEDYKIESIGIEETTIRTKDLENKFYSLNEILIREKRLNTAHLNILIDDNILEKFVGDGILISTSFGSTAYNLSFGGSIVYNELHTMQITPVAPLNSKSYRVLQNSVIIPEQRKVKLISTSRNKNFILTIDGENHIYNHVVEIEIIVKRKIKLLRMNEYDYTKKINEKFL